MIMMWNRKEVLLDILYKGLMKPVILSSNGIKYKYKVVDNTNQVILVHRIEQELVLLV